MMRMFDSTHKMLITREMVDDGLVSIGYEGDNMIIYVRGQGYVKLEPQVIKLMEAVLQTSHETTTNASDKCE